MSRVVDPVLDELRQLLLRMGSLAEAILEKSLLAVWKRDDALAREVQTDDLAIDDSRCHSWGPRVFWVCTTPLSPRPYRGKHDQS